MIKLRLIEQYQELIECHPSQVSYLWKCTSIIAYAICIPTSYFFSAVFYYFWNTVSDGKCFIWSKVYLVPEISRNRNTSLLKSLIFNESFNWVKDIDIDYQYPHYCPYVHFISLMSCSISMIMMVMFIICGKGGYGINLFVSPWRITYAAFICNLTMMVATGIAVNTFTIGFLYFAEELFERFHKLMENKSQLYNYNKFCKIFQKLIISDNLSNVDACGIFVLVQTSGWIMMWSWIAGFCIVCLRIITSADFQLIDIKIYGLCKPESKEKSAFSAMLHNAIKVTYAMKKDDSIINDEKNKEKVL